MRNFDYIAARKVEDAFIADGREIMPIAGGTELLNWFRLGIAGPERVVDLGRIDGLAKIETKGERLTIGALNTLNAIGGHAAVRENAAVLAKACHAAASAQIRNRATLGGNLLQKTRCAYFRAEAPVPWPCNKRTPGSGCAAKDGMNERHAIFGWTDVCVATQPSDPIVALAALDAEIEVLGRGGKRILRATEFHLTQAESTDAARIETRLQPGEIITAFHIPIRKGARSTYVKVRERASYEYALVSAAAVVEMAGGVIGKASIALGSVAQKPWRLTSAEAQLVGKALSHDVVLPIIKAAMADAKPLTHNGYKVGMAAAAATRALLEAA